MAQWGIASCAILLGPDCDRRCAKMNCWKEWSNDTDKLLDNKLTFTSANSRSRYVLNRGALRHARHSIWYRKYMCVLQSQIWAQRTFCDFFSPWSVRFLVERFRSARKSAPRCFALTSWLAPQCEVHSLCFRCTLDHWNRNSWVQ